MKHILTSGCSFTRNERYQLTDIEDNKEFLCTDENRKSWPEYLQEHLGEEYKVYNLGAATNDNCTITRVLFYWIKKLISQGVSPSDIIVIGQWSDPNRESIYFENRNITEKTKHIAHTIGYHDEWLTEKGMFFLTGGYSPPMGEGTAVDFFDIEEFITCHEVDVNRNNIVNPTLRWLESWSHFELYCEKQGIKTFWMSMRNIFSKEAYDVYFGAPDNNDEATSTNNWMNDYGVLKPYLDQVPIDKDNYWHHLNYNGLLEWTLNKKGEWGQEEYVNPFQESKGMDWDTYLRHQQNGWGHPSPEIMDKFVKEVLLDLLGLNEDS